MLSFSAIYNQLLLMINRPASETNVLVGAKWEINQAIKFLQRDHAYAYTERLIQFTYPGSTLMIDTGVICAGGLMRDVMSVQDLGITAPSLPYGKPTKVMSFNQLQQMRMQFSRTHAMTPGDWYAPQNFDLYDITIEDTFRHDQIAFLVGPNFGMYPAAQPPKNLVVNCHIWLPPLIQDSDTNFFLEYASDVVLMIAMKRMHLYMKADTRYGPTEAEFKEAYSTLLTWDSQVKESPNTSLAGHTNS